MKSKLPPKPCLVLTAIFAVVWMVSLADWKWFHVLESSERLAESVSFADNPAVLIFAGVHLLALPLGVAWLLWARLPAFRGWRTLWTVASGAYVFWWQCLLFFVTTAENWETFRAYTARIGTFGLFLIGLLWVIWAVEKGSQYYCALRRSRAQDDFLWAESAQSQTGNPFDLEAWYYGKRQPRLHQSLLAFSSYSLAFMVAFLVLTQMGGCSEEYELPAGGGAQQQIAQKVRIQKVIRKKFVLNPLSTIIFKVPPIEEIRLQINEKTKHAYTVGYGKGDGAGYGGKGKGGIRFVRLEYGSKSWNFGNEDASDRNMLAEFGARLRGHKIARKPEAMRISRLRAFKPEKSPPLLYMTGMHAFSISKKDEKTLREYLLQKHGMLFASAGSSTFHSQFTALMSRVLPDVRPVAIPLDDPIHKTPYQIPFFPFVSAHGGQQALGWKVDGRWVVYYHPGDIGDAWTNSHSGVSPSVYEACYQLGVNVINYAHVQTAMWRTSRKKK